METLVLPLSLIHINDEYATAFPEMPDEEYQLLKENIRASSMHTPIIVCPTTPLPHGDEPSYTALAGHNRIKIHQELGLTTIRASLAITPDEKLAALFDNVFRRQLDKATLTRYTTKYREYTQSMHTRIIPALQDVFQTLSGEMKTYVQRLSEEGQEKFVEDITRAARLNTKKPALTSSPLDHTTVPTIDSMANAQTLTRQLTELQQTLKDEQRAALTTQNRLARDLDAARDAHQTLEDRIASMQDQVELAKGEVNAARLVADERLGRTNGLTDIPPTPLLLLQGLEYAQQLTGHLSLFAAKVPTLNQTDALTAHQTLRQITTHLTHLHELLLPTHEALLPDSRTGKQINGKKLTLVAEQ